MRLRLISFFVFAVLLMVVSCRPVTPAPVAIPTLEDTPAFTPAASPVAVDTVAETPAPTLTDMPLPTLTPTEIIVPTLTVTAMTAACPWNWAYGDATVIETQLQQALDDDKIVSWVKAQSYGETGGDDCSYHEMEITAAITVYVMDTTDLPTLTDLATRVEAVLQSATSQYGHTPSLDNRSVLTFKAPTGSTAADCVWQFATSSCQE